MRVVWSLLIGLQGAPTEPAWHERYDRGIALVEPGQGAAARAELEAALPQRPEEGLRVPTRGLRYVDYLPYLQIARAHIRLGNRECARDAVAISHRLGEISDTERDELRALVEK